MCRHKQVHIFCLVYFYEILIVWYRLTCALGGWSWIELCWIKRNIQNGRYFYTMARFDTKSGTGRWACQQEEFSHNCAKLCPIFYGRLLNWLIPRSLRQVYKHRNETSVNCSRTWRRSSSKRCRVVIVSVFKVNVTWASWCLKSAATWLFVQR